MAGTSAIPGGPAPLKLGQTSSPHIPKNASDVTSPTPTVPSSGIQGPSAGPLPRLPNFYPPASERPNPAGTFTPPSRQEMTDTTKTAMAATTLATQPPPAPDDPSLCCALLGSCV